MRWLIGATDANLAAILAALGSEEAGAPAIRIYAASGDPLPLDTVEVSATPDNADERFRYDPEDGTWVFNLKLLSPPFTASQACSIKMLVGGCEIGDDRSDVR